MIKSKVTKKQGFTLSLEDIFLKKNTGWGQTDASPNPFRVKYPSLFANAGGTSGLVYCKPQSHIQNPVEYLR